MEFIVIVTEVIFPDKTLFSTKNNISFISSQNHTLWVLIRLPQGSRGGRILHPGMHKSGSGLLKILKVKSAGCMFFPVGRLLIMIGLFD